VYCILQRDFKSTVDEIMKEINIEGEIKEINTSSNSIVQKEDLSKSLLQSRLSVNSVHLESRYCNDNDSNAH
jgi:hypothetical protein